MVLKRELVFIGIGLLFLGGSLYSIIVEGVFDLEFVTLITIGIYLVLSPVLYRVPLLSWGFEVGIMFASLVDLYFDLTEAVFGVVTLAQIPTSFFFAVRAFFPRTFVRRMAKRQRNTLQNIVASKTQPTEINHEKVKEQAMKKGISEEETERALERIGVEDGKIKPSWEYLPAWYDQVLERLHLRALNNRLTSFIGFLSLGLGLVLPPDAGGLLALGFGLFLLFTGFRMFIAPLLRLLELVIAAGFLVLLRPGWLFSQVFDIITLGLFMVIFFARGLTPSLFLRLFFVNRERYRVLRTIIDLEQESKRPGRGVPQEDIIKRLVAEGWSEEDSWFYLHSTERLNMTRDMDGGISLTAFYSPAYYRPILGYGR